MKPIGLVVFDWDGTLVDSTRAIAESIQGAARDLGLPVPSDAAASHVIGLGLKDALRISVPDLPADLLPAFVERYRVHYFERDTALKPFAGIQTLLDTLQNAGVPLAVATGKGRLGLNRALATAGWQGCFVTTRCADEGKPKPDPDMLFEVCRQVGVPPARTVMVGDTSHDIHMAHSAGAWSIGVTYGAHPRDELERAGAHHLCQDPAELLNHLLAHLGPRPAPGA